MNKPEWRRLLAGQVSRLCIFDLDRGADEIVYETDAAVLEAPNWRANADELIVNQDGLSYRVPLSGAEEPILIPTGAVVDANNDHVLSPDGKTLYLSTKSGPLYAVSLENGDVRRVSNDHETPFHYYLHGVSPDGRMLAYVGHDRAENTFDLYLIPSDGGEDIRLTNTAFHHDGVEFSADGRALFFNSERASTSPGHSQLFRMSIDGAGIEQLTFDDRVNWFPHPSPTGDSLLYLSYEPGVTGHPANQPVELRLFHMGEREPRALRSLFGGQGTVNVNSWSPDGRRFAYVEYPVLRDASIDQEGKDAR